MGLTRRIRRKAGLALAFCSLLVLAENADVVFTRWHRLSIEPIVSPRAGGWQSAGTFNPAVVFHRGKFVMLYRAQDHAGTSRLGYAESSDGIHFVQHPEPVLSPETEYEKDGGVEDPRLVKIGSTYYLTYTGYNKKDLLAVIAKLNPRCENGESSYRKVSRRRKPPKGSSYLARRTSVMQCGARRNTSVRQNGDSVSSLHYQGLVG